MQYAGAAYRQRSLECWQFKTTNQNVVPSMTVWFLLTDWYD
jgi:hypothetical protein